MKNLGYYNGKIGLLEEMTVPMLDRGGYFGDGVYDAGFARNGKLYAMDDHINRLYGNAAKLDIHIPMEKEEFAKLLLDLLKKLDDNDLFVYYQVTRGTALRDHTYEKCDGNIWVMIKPANITKKNDPVGLITTEDTRFFHCDIKTLNLLLNVMAAQKAKEAGCVEAVLYRPGGRVTECAHSNVHIVKDGVVRTAPTDELILPGITRAHMLKMCEKLGIPYVEEAFTLDDLYNADEVLVTSSTKFIIRANMIDGKPVGGKAIDVYEKLSEALFQEFVDDTKL